MTRHTATAFSANGRPLRVLHIGNIANNAYNNAKLQRQAGIEADVLCYDYYHIFATPEWEDADFERFEGDQFFPCWKRIDMKGFQRPEWFIQGERDHCVRYLLAKNQERPLLTWLRRQQLKISNWFIYRFKGVSASELLLGQLRSWLTLPDRAASRLCAWAGDQLKRPALGGTQYRLPALILLLPLHAVTSLAIALLLTPLLLLTLLAAAGRQANRGLVSLLERWRGPDPSPYGRHAFRQKCAWIAQEWSRCFPDKDPLNVNDLARFQGIWGEFSAMLSHYDIVQAYATDGIWPLLCGHSRYVCFEHGTLRNLGEATETLDRVACLAYRLSAATFVTNGDCLTPARRIGIGHIQPSLHGIDDGKLVPDRSLRAELLSRYGVSRLYLCPLRHDWVVKGTDRYIRALPEIVRQSGSDFRLVLIPWGAQVEDSRRLAWELGVENQIAWHDPLPHRALARWYAAVDCVFDQIALPHFGGTAPETMGCGSPVIMSYDPAATAWIVPEPAPILAAWTEQEIVSHVVALLDPTYHAEVCQRGRDWFVRNHSSRRILDDHDAVYRQALGLPAELRRTA